MKKNYKHLGVVLVVIIFVLIVLVIAYKPKNHFVKIQAFSLNEYSDVVETYEEQHKVGAVNNASVAISISKRLWSHKYGRIDGVKYDITRGNEILVYFDNKNDCWCVKGTLNDNELGCVPCAIIKTDGTVLAVFME